MRIRAARRIAPAYRGQWNGVRIERADGENAHRQSQRNHPMREHGSRWQQSELRRLALLSGCLIDDQSGTVMQPSTHPPLPIVIFADERR